MKDPEKRITPERALEHPFIVQVLSLSTFCSTEYHFLFECSFILILVIVFADRSPPLMWCVSYNGILLYIFILYYHFHCFCIPGECSGQFSKNEQIQTINVGSKLLYLHFFLSVLNNLHLICYQMILQCLTR